MHVNCSLRNEPESDLRGNEHYLSGSENKAWKKSRQVIVALCLVTMNRWLAVEIKRCS